MIELLMQEYVTATEECQKVQLDVDEALENVLFEENAQEAFDIDQSGIQASCAVCNVRKARRLARLCISEHGELLMPRVRLAKDLLERRLYSIGYGAEEERKRDLRFIKALTFLCESIEAQRLIKKMSRPIINRLAEIAIRETLMLPESVLVTDAHVRQAVFTALCTTLRQSLGSCFATAPAIMVHENQPLLFLRDLDELMTTAKLKRTVAGNEYTVPMSSSSGQGDLKKPLVITSPLTTSTPVWRSAPLLRVVQALGLIDSEAKGEKGYHSLLALLESLFKDRLASGEWMLTNVEEILKLLILKHLSLSEREFLEFEHRPKAMLQTSMIVTAPQAGGTARDTIFQKFFAMWENGKRLFVAEEDCALLKSWEFTIASFAEVKFDLARWNFYSSLGVNWDDEGGIGQVLYDIAKKRVDETNLELEQEREKFDAISLETEYLQRRLQTASTENEIQWLKMEYQTRQAEQYHIKELCDMIAEKANKVAKLHQFMIDSYDQLMKEYFQEIYDADLHDVQAGPFDDAPAGFRLIYKHGRTNPSLWTKITSLPEYIEALVSFFTITEQDLLHAQEIKGIEAEFSSIITRLANHIRSDLFIESALARTARAHGVRPVEHPLQHLDRIEKKPWVYTSGGNMNTLVASYFCLDGNPEEVGRWVDNETELLAFLLDTARQAASRAGSVRPTSLLMHSPTHAFTFTPSAPGFDEGWAGDTYSYSWITNHVRDPARAFYSSCVMDQASVNEFCSLITEKLPREIRTRFTNEAPTIPGFLRPYDLAREIHRLFSLDIVLRHHTSILQEVCLDGLLYESAPYTPPENLRDVLIDVMTALCPKEMKKNGVDSIVRTTISSVSHPVRAKDLLCLIKTATIRLCGTYRFEHDLLASLIAIMRQKRLLPPSPVIFADSNWVKDFFAFLVSPVTQEIELWSVNAYGTEGRSIPHWKPWLNGSRKDVTWGVLVNPNQYRAFLGSSQRR